MQGELERVRQMAVMLAVAGDAFADAPASRGARARGQSSPPAPWPVARMQAALSDLSWLTVVSAAVDRAWHPGDSALSLAPAHFDQWPLSAAALTNMVTSIVASTEAQAHVWRRPGTSADLFVAGAPMLDREGQVAAVMCLGASAEAAKARVASMRRATWFVLFLSSGLAALIGWGSCRLWPGHDLAKGAAWPGAGGLRDAAELELDRNRPRAPWTGTYAA